MNLFVRWGKYAGALVLMGSLAVVGCKSGQNTASNPKDKKNNSTTNKDTSSPINNLGNLGSIGGNTNTVDEPKSGMDAELSFDETVRTGTLSNGMRYYIRKNGKPENRIELRLAVNAGSMQEEDDQRGLAHFVEHMAFNGTRNFKKNELVNFLESTGVRFGADLNAYTSFDETVYMLQLPTDKEGLVDKGLVVMSDWATGVSMDGDEIDKERGVIESEWRTRLGADERMRQVYWPKIFYQSRYADRLPIGTMEVIKGCAHERLRTFYKDWYRPNLMALVVVGDLDVDDMEKRIQKVFAPLQNPENPRKKEIFPVPDHAETFVAIATDKEATGTNMQLIYKHPATETKTIDDYRSTLMHSLYSGMLNDRFTELGQSADAPFFYAGVGYGGWVRARDVYSASAQCKENKALDALKVLLTEHARVQQHGFTDTELERQKASYLKRFEKQYNERDKTQSSALAMECVYHFLDDQPMPGIEKEWQMVKDLLPTIKVNELNELAKKWIIETNRSIIVTAPVKEGITVPTEAQVREVLESFKNIKTEAYKDKFLDAPLLPQEPKAGSVVKTEVINDETGKLNVTEVTLSNGVRVVMKPTTYQNDQILLSGFSAGGSSLYDDKDYYNATFASEIVGESGIGVFDKIALDKKLSDKNVRLGASISETHENFSGNSSVEDFETMLQLVYAHATQVREDKDAFERFKNQSKEEIRNVQSNPTFFFYDQMSRAKSGDYLRRRMLPSEADIDGVSLSRALEIFRDRFSDFSDFTFVLVGNFEVEKIKPLLEKYLASLPSKNRKENWKELPIPYAFNGANTQLQKGIAEQCNVYVGFLKADEWTREKAHHVQSMTQVLNIMVRENLREDKGGVYSPYVGGAFTKSPKPMTDITVMFQCAPDNAENLIGAVKEEIKDLQTNGPSTENFDKVREIQRREFESNTEKNNYWLNSLTAYYREGRDPKDIYKFPALVDKLTKEDIQRAAQQYISLEKPVTVVVKPEAKP